MTLYHWLIFLGGCSLFVCLLALMTLFDKKDDNYDFDLIVDPDYREEIRALQTVHNSAIPKERREIGRRIWL